MEALRPCGSTLRGPNRYSKAELEVMLRARNLPFKKHFTVDQMCQMLGLVPGLPMIENPYRQIFTERLAAAAAGGKVLDVSFIKPDGHGAVIMDRPTARSAKVGPLALNIISSNHYGFATAMQILGPEYAHYVAEFDRLLAQRTQMAQTPRIKTPRATTPRQLAPLIPLAPIAYTAMPVTTQVRRITTPPKIAAPPQIPTAPLPTILPLIRTPPVSPRSPVIPRTPVKQIYGPRSPRSPGMPVPIPLAPLPIIPRSPRQ